MTASTPASPDPPTITPVSADRAVVVSSVQRRFGPDRSAAALDGLTLEVAEGSLTAVLGPSGCGKTTLLRAIAGTERIDSGSICIGGRVVARVAPGERSVHEPPEKRRVGLVPQDGALFPHLDVAGNIGFGAHHLDRRRRSRRVDEMLELVDLAGYGSRRPDELSGGERQRVALARALAPDPEVVLLDEPFSALDAALRASIRDEVAELLRRAGTTAVIVTHDRTEAMAIADDLAVMRSGRIVQSGRPDDLYRHPVDGWVAGFLGEAILLPGHVGPSGSSATCILGEVAVTTPRGAGARGSSGHGTVMIRPEQVVRLPVGAADSGTPATVLGVRFLGPDVAVDLGVSTATNGGPAARSVGVPAVWSSSSHVPVVGEALVVGVEGRAVFYAGSAEPVV